MSIGPLSEWVTAAAEIAAVCIALFLPVYDKKQEKRKKTRNMKAIFKFLIKKALEEKDTSNLESCFKISYLIIDSNDDKQIYSLLQHAIEILNNQNIPENKKEENIGQVLEYLNKKKDRKNKDREIKMNF